MRSSYKQQVRDAENQGRERVLKQHKRQEKDMGSKKGVRQQKKVQSHKEKIQRESKDDARVSLLKA